MSSREPKVALVTGASRGVGKGVAAALADVGYVEPPSISSQGVLFQQHLLSPLLTTRGIKLRPSRDKRKVELWATYPPTDSMRDSRVIPPDPRENLPVRSRPPSSR